MQRRQPRGRGFVTKQWHWGHGGRGREEVEGKEAQLTNQASKKGYLLQCSKLKRTCLAK